MPHSTTGLATRQPVELVAKMYNDIPHFVSPIHPAQDVLREREQMCARCLFDASPLVGTYMRVLDV